MSEWKEGAIKRRDFRAAKDSPEVPKPGHRKKDTKNWCRGKVGTPHSFRRTMDHWAARTTWSLWVHSKKTTNIIFRCTNCGKICWEYELSAEQKATANYEVLE